MTSLPRPVSALFFFCAFVHVSFSFAAPSPSELIESFSAKADHSNLASTRPWLLLGHYEKTLFGGYRSEIDGPKFFLASDGRTNPQAELKASLHALFTPSPKDADPDEHFLCRYPARATWLIEHLQIPLETLPMVTCERFDTWYKVIGAHSATLVFATYYVNNPASMFGHTFLRLDRENAEDKHHLLSYSINFAANTGNDNGMLFAVLGIVGGYPGTYSTYPYYIKTQQYSNIESRDLWEYNLDLNPQEVGFLLKHVWEVGHTYNDYFFFDENCSYQLLSILEVARPNLHLRSHLSPYFVPPSDTVKALATYDGTIRSVDYRPSRLKSVEARLDQLNWKEKSVLGELIEKKDTKMLERKLSPEKSGEVMDAAIDLLAYRNKLPTKTEFQKQLLLDRAKFPASEDVQIKRPKDLPHEGHESGRISLSGGSYFKQAFYEFNYRPVFHDLMSYDIGYPKSAEIIGMDTTVRYYQKENKFSLEELAMIRVTSLFPVRRFMWKPSWGAAFGFETMHDNECGRCLTAFVRVGPGLAYQIGDQKLVLYALTNGNLEFGPWNSVGYRFGPQAQSGIIWSPIVRYRMRLSGKYSWSPTSDVDHTAEAFLEQRVNFTKDIDLRVSGILGQERKEAKATLGFYF